MADNLSNYAEVLTLNFLMNTAAVTRPTAWFVGLHTGDPGETGANNEIGTGVGYSRQSATFGSAATAGDTLGTTTTSNTGALTFGPCTTTAWGTVSYISVWTAATGGNALWVGALTNSTSIAVNDQIQIPVGGLVLTMG